MNLKLNNMELILGVLLICVAITMYGSAYFNIVKRKKSTFIGGGANLIAFASIIFLAGLFQIMNT